MKNILIVGNRGGSNVGESLHLAALALGHNCTLIESKLAYGGHRFWRSFNWHLLNRRPSTYSVLEANVLKHLEQHRPSIIILTGLVPLSQRLATELQLIGAKTANFATDDPFNPAHYSPRYLQSLHRYDVILTPRQANRIQLYESGARQVCDLPFGYDPRHVQSDDSTLLKRNDSVLFVGGADADRFSILRPLCESNVVVEVFGDYWQSFRHKNLINHGHASPGTLASVTTQAAVNLILVRRANRDGHVMRSFEAAACGGCLLVEDTAEHRRIYGETVAYFSNEQEMIKQVKLLLADPKRRRTMAQACRQRVVTEHKNTYADRLQTILSYIKQA